MIDDKKVFDEEEMFDNLVFDKAPLETYNNIGKRGIRRLDGFEKATGRAIYTIDMQLPGMLYGRFFTSPYPHAEIKRMDTGRAEALPGRQVRAQVRRSGTPARRTSAAIPLQQCPCSRG